MYWQLFCLRRREGVRWESSEFLFAPLPTHELCPQSPIYDKLIFPNTIIWCNENLRWQKSQRIATFADASKTALAKAVENLSRHYLPTQWKFAMVKVLVPMHIWTALAKVTENCYFYWCNQESVGKSCGRHVVTNKKSPQKRWKVLQTCVFLLAMQ